MKRIAPFIVLLLLAPQFCFAADTPKAKNVILMIGDGMGFNSHIAGSYYRYGELGKQSVDSFPVHVGMTTFAQRKGGVPIPAGERGYDPELFWKSAKGTDAGPSSTTTDSAAASTALHSGSKTISGRIGMSDTKQPLVLLPEIAAKTGRVSGVVTTVQASHATPAGFSAHNEKRGNYPEIFTEMYEKSPLSVITGAGHPHPAFDSGSDKDPYKYVGSEEVWKKIEAESSKPVLERSKFVHIVPSRGDIPAVDGFVTNDKTDEAKAKAAFAKIYKIKDLDIIDKIPTLTDLSIEALDILAKKGDKGFVIMIEGGAIDHGNHARNIRHASYEHVAFMKAIEAVCKWVEENSSWDETLLIVTADHATGAIWGPGTYEDENDNGNFDEGDTFNGFVPVENKGAGNFAGVQYASGGHTNAIVPLWAKGVGSKLFID
ncbi:MAG: alkaline phosphatase, partial [Planctomycetaceae bacterium]|nr:alkaline phosphatase [Planctomycetaceae bacterium]